MILQAVAAMTLQPDPKVMQSRAKDWRNGAVVYQVFVDRFAPSKNLDAKKHLYSSPRSLKTWDELPVPGKNNTKLGMWSHETEFWGGDLESFESKLDYIRDLGTDVVYFQPIFEAFTNHKYDTSDYFAVDPQYGSRDDLKRIIKSIHKSNMRVILDGVFNHMGQNSPKFIEAKNNSQSIFRNWFYFGPENSQGYRGWVNVANLPALNLENTAVRDGLWNDKGSVVREYLKDGIDGWRLDVAFELGPKWLQELTKAAHSERKGSAVIGEISGYPADWFPAVDGVFNFHLVSVAMALVNGTMTGGQAGTALEHLVADAGTENLLKSWLVMDNHDTPRISSILPLQAQRHFVQTLQFTLPGCPVVYYGSELGMTGTGDPQNRAPMRWDLVNDSNPDLIWTKKLIAMRKKMPALQYGDVKPLATEKLFAFARLTEKVSNAVIVVANPTSKVVKETFPSRVGRIMSWGEVKDAISGKTYRSVTGMLTVEVPPMSVQILLPVTTVPAGVSQYHRIDQI